jgi:hypothetical protein
MVALVVLEAAFLAIVYVRNVYIMHEPVAITREFYCHHPWFVTMGSFVGGDSGDGPLYIGGRDYGCQRRWFYFQEEEPAPRLQ